MLPDLTSRSDATERIDQADSDPVLFERTLDQFTWINLLLSRSRSLLKRYVVSDMKRDPGRTYEVLDVGSGGGDIPRWLIHHCRRKDLRVRVTGIDLDRRAIEYARRRFGAVDGMEFHRKSVFELADFDRPFDYVIANHFLHHLEDERIGDALNAISAKTERLFLVNDLRRSLFSYLAFSLFAGPLFHRSFIFEDGRVSITRGFKRHELRAFADQVTGPPITVRTAFPGHLYLVGSKL